MKREGEATYPGIPPLYTPSEATYPGIPLLYTRREAYMGGYPPLYTRREAYMGGTHLLHPQGGIYERYTPLLHPQGGIYGGIHHCYTHREAYGRYTPLLHTLGGIGREERLLRRVIASLPWWVEASAQSVRLSPMVGVARLRRVCLSLRGWVLPVCAECASLPVRVTQLRVNVSNAPPVGVAG